MGSEGLASFGFFHFGQAGLAGDLGVASVNYVASLSEVNENGMVWYVLVVRSLKVARWAKLVRVHDRIGDQGSLEHLSLLEASKDARLMIVWEFRSNVHPWIIRECFCGLCHG